MKEEDKTLVLGIGNTGRQDDGLGWLFLDFLQESKLRNLDLEYRYQLQIEDAELLCNYKTVIFLDATKEDTKGGFYYRPCKASENHSFSSHELHPETILFLTHNLYQHKPEAFILGIQGYKWDLEMGLSEIAEKNLFKAQQFLINRMAKHKKIEYL